MLFLKPLAVDGMLKSQTKKNHGLSTLHVTRHINDTAESAGYTRLSTITKTSIKNILDAAEIKPFRIQYYCEKRDPEFEAKMHQVLLVYKQLELLFDENGELYIPSGEQDVHTV